jgi:hypothetical protein
MAEDPQPADEDPKPAAPAPARGGVLLLVGMFAGIGCAVYGLIRPEAGLPEDAVARVNDRLILRADWERGVAAVANDRRTPLTAADRQRILDRLIDEELLVQHGLDLGLVQRDRRLRGQLVSEVMAAAAGDASQVDERELRAYYEAHRDYFGTPGRLRVAATRRGRPFSPPVPNALLSPAKLREYLGPKLTRIALELEEGDVHAVEDGAVVIRVLAKEPPRTPPFSAIRAEVRAAVQREAEERAVRRLLEELRAEGRVVVRTDPE